MEIQTHFQEFKNGLTTKFGIFKFSTNPFQLLLLAAALGLVILSMVAYSSVWTRFQKYRASNKLYEKIPGIGRFGVIGYLVGNVDVFYYAMRHLPASKASIQYMSAFNVIETMRSVGFVRLNVGLERNVAIFNAKAAEALMTSNTNITKSHDYDFLTSWLGNGLLTSTGDHWRRHRKVLTPAFHFRILDSFVPIMNECSGEMGKLIEEKQGIPIDIRSYITNSTLDTICETAMGVRVGAKSGNQHQYVKPLNRVLILLIERMLNPLIHNNLIYRLTSAGRQYSTNLNKIHQFVRNVIQDRKVEMQQMIENKQIDIDLNSEDQLMMVGHRKRYAFLDTLLMEHLKDPQNFSMQDIEDEVNTFMFEGHDTTSGSLIYSLMLIGTHPDVQDKIYEELETIFGDEMSQSITIDHCRQMKYLEMCIKESLRLYPSVPFLSRKIEHNFKLDNYTVPVGCGAAIIVYALHRDPVVFPQPERFIPERFKPDAPIHRQPYAYMPFSAGPRNCIGQKFAMLEMKILIASVLRQFRLNTITKRDQIDVGFSVVIKADSPVMIQFEKRTIISKL